MASLFKLGRRYHEIKYKFETLPDMSDVFFGLSCSCRSTRFERIIIIMITIEIKIYLTEMYRGH